MPTSSKSSEGPEQVDTWLSFLFSTLEERDVTYATLRFDSTLFAPDCEVDLLVHPASLNAVLDGIRELCERFPHLRVAAWKVMPRHAATIILVWPDSNGAWRYYFFDIRCGIRKSGSLLLHGSALGRLTVWDGHLRTRRLRDDYEIALLIVRNILDQREYSPRHIAIVKDRSTDGVAEAMRYMGWKFTGIGSAPIARVASGSTRRSISYFRYAATAVQGRLRQRALGINVVIYGPDGVGKSTQAQLIADFFSAIRIRRVHVYHHLVEVGVLTSRTENKVRTVKKRVYQNADNPWMIRGIVVLSYLKKFTIVAARVQPMLRRGHFFVHDRYLLDVFQKLYWSRGVRVQCLERVLSPLTPKEPFLIVLHAPPELVAERTGELDIDGAAAAYRLLFDCLRYGGSRFDGLTLVDASQSIDVVHDCIVRHVLDVQTRRALGHPPHVAE